MCFSQNYASKIPPSLSKNKKPVFELRDYLSPPFPVYGKWGYVCAMPRREEAIRPNLGRETVSWEYVNVYGSGWGRGGGLLVGYGPPPRINLAFLTLLIRRTISVNYTKLDFEKQTLDFRCLFPET